MVVRSWILLMLGLGALGLLLGLRTSLPGPASTEYLATNPGEVVAREAGIPARDTLRVTLSHSDLTIDAPAFQTAVTDLTSLLRSQRRGAEAIFRRIDAPGETMLDEERLMSSDRRTALVVASTSAPLDEAAAALTEIPGLLMGWQEAHPDFLLHWLAAGTADREIIALINRDLDRSLLVTLPLTLLILLFAFRSVVAGLLPLVLALLCLVGSLGAAAVLSNIYGSVSATAAQLVVLLVLALGVDYALFMVSRVREEQARGTPLAAAVTRTRLTSGRAILWSGVTVALSLTGLLLMEDSILTSMALVSILAVSITVASTVSVLPSLFLLLGSRLERGRVRGHSSRSSPGRLLSLAIRRPLLVLLAGGAILGALSWQASALHTGSTVNPHLLPLTLQGVRAFSHLERTIPGAAGIDLSLILHGEALPAAEEDGRVDELTLALLEHEQVSGPIRVERSSDGLTARYVFLVSGAGDSAANRRLVDTLRTTLLPAHLDPAGIEGFISGTLAYERDEIAEYAEHAPRVFAVVLALSFMLLLIAFRSVVIPCKAILLNLLSTAASFGALVILFQTGVVPGWNYGVIEAFVPPLLFAILFGISMDYHVFLLSRIREEYCRHGDMARALEEALARTSGTITSAALIMASVFAVIATLELPLMQQLGAGLAFAILVDATIIRSALLPAGMMLLGRWNWYLPGWLGWLPRAGVEEEQ